jgi:hypothetical protein
MHKFLAAALLGLTIPGAAFCQYGGDVLTKKKQDDWMRCLKSSYRNQRAKTIDKNMAAELSMQACASEEEALWTYSAENGVPKSVFMHLKAQTKKVLIEEGR